MSKIVVIGGTGTVGSQTVQELLRRGAEVRVMTRSANRIASLPTGVEGVTGSMLEPESLPAVFAGADKLFLITPLARDETAQGIDAVDAAVAAGIRRIVYLSVHRIRQTIYRVDRGGDWRCRFAAAQAAGVSFASARVERSRLEELPSRVRPTGGMHQLRPAHVIVGDIAVGLQDAFELSQKFLWSVAHPPQAEVEHHAATRFAVLPEIPLMVFAPPIMHLHIDRGFIGLNVTAAE